MTTAESHPIAPQGPRKRHWAFAVAAIAVGCGALAGISRNWPLEARDGALSIAGELSADPASELPQAPSAPEILLRALEVSPGDTLAHLLNSAGASSNTAQAAIDGLKSVFDPRDIKPGKPIEIGFTRTPAGMDLSLIRLKPSPETVVSVRRQSDGSWLGDETIRPLSRQLRSFAGQIENSLFAAGSQAGVPTPAMIEMIHAFGFAVDFQREIRRGDRFELLWGEFRDDQQHFVRSGQVHYASLTLSGRRLEYWRHDLPDGSSGFFDRSGASVKKTLMRTPIDGARLTSSYGRRRHPVLGYSKMHRGVDFGAPVGTPIYAAGDGVIERIGPFSSYGNYIRIRHNSTYQTAYAHMSSFARNLRRGSRVTQGQTIGYVGRTGRVNGAHLHYEVHVSGRQTNPRTIQLPSGETLTGEELDRFAQARDRIDRRRGRVMLDALFTSLAPRMVSSNR